MTRQYLTDAQNDAKEAVEYYLDEVVEQLLDSGCAGTDMLNDYSDGDSYHHENHVDKSYRLTEAAELLEQLSRWEETDSGLWDRQDPRDASTQAAFTYGTCVMSCWKALIEEINEDDQIEVILQDARVDELPEEKIAQMIRGRISEILKE